MERIATVYSIFLLFLAFLLLFYGNIKRWLSQRRQKLKAPSSTSQKESWWSKQKNSLKPKISFWGIAGLLAAVFGVAILGLYFYYDTYPRITYTFESSNSLPNYWQTDGNIRVQNKCLLGTGEIRLKVPSDMTGWSKIEVIAAKISDLCGSQNLKLSIQTGEIISQYGIKTADEIGENTKGSYHTGSVFYREISNNHLLSSPLNDLIQQSESSGPYSVGVRKARWWQFLTPRYSVFYLDYNSPIKEQTVAFTGTSMMPGVDQGKLSIKISGGAIKEIRIYKQ